MRKKISQKLEIPEGIICEYSGNILKCKKDSQELFRKIDSPQVKVILDSGSVILECEKGNKNIYKIIMSLSAHIRNIFKGLNEKFVYELEAVNVHFPMSIKSGGDKLTITNFLGEKVPRQAKVLPGVEIEVKGQKITVSSPNKEAAGQTAANLEKATKVKGRDRRIYQDGIFITEKPRRSSFAAARESAAERGTSQQEQTEDNRGQQR